MRNAAVGLLSCAVLCCAFAVTQGVARAQGNGAGKGAVVTLEQAPTDRAIPVPKDKLAQYFKDMDSKKLGTLRMIEGGRFSVNLRRVTDGEKAIAYPKTIEVWVVLEGAGTITTGGNIVNGKIIGGVTNPLNVGDVEFIPANLPHELSAVTGKFTCLNTRWDVDWPANSKLGAGNAPPTGPATDAPAAGGGRGQHLLEYAPTDHAVYIPKEKLDGYLKDMDDNHIQTLRMIEGGHFNVNIRRIKEPSIEFHEVTNDMWDVIEGSGTANWGFKTDKGDEHAGMGKRIEGTGVENPENLGDMLFVPANFTHGFSQVNGVVAWLNIRWDVDWDTQ
jgi:mannose-6-phosphate isomerase-like protein (cupin superfamily)